MAGPAAPCNVRFADSLVQVPRHSETGGAPAANGENRGFLVDDRRVAASSASADPIKSSTPEAFAVARDEGIRVVMLTGGQPDHGAGRGEELGIAEVRADVLPQEKAQWSRRFAPKPGRAMAGDE